jgi:hypothetical protein
VDLGAETKPFNASIGAYNAKGMLRRLASRKGRLRR